MGIIRNGKPDINNIERKITLRILPGIVIGVCSLIGFGLWRSMPRG
jgi:hypothetical protein